LSDSHIFNNKEHRSAELVKLAILLAATSLQLPVPRISAYKIKHWLNVIIAQTLFIKSVFESV